MQNILYLISGIIIGGIIGYLLIRIIFAKTLVPKEALEQAEKKILELQLENAARISKSELSQAYITRELHEALASTLKTTKENLDKEKLQNINHQNNILRLTSQTAERISKAELEQHYTTRESFDIIFRKLSAAESELERREKALHEISKELTEFQQKEIHLNEKLTIFREELEELRKQSQEQFKNLATEVLEDKKKIFVDENKKELNTVLDPFKLQLDQFRDKVEATRKEDIQELTSLKKEIETLQKLNIQLSDDAKNLATALKSDVKMQGSWGEDRLNMILEVEGLQKYIDYSREEMYNDDEQGRSRKPDFILKLPDAKHIIIDSKVSLTAYVNYFNAATAEDKLDYLKQHLRSVTNHIDFLAEKNYQSLAGLTTPDYVFMFMPVESALTLALNQNSEIFNNALRKKIILITPTTLVATLKVVKILWQKENQVKNVEEIFRQCGELYNKFTGFLEDMMKIEGALDAASKTHQEAMNKLTSGTKKGHTIIGRFEAIRNLEAKTNKLIPARFLNEVDLLQDDSESKDQDAVSGDTPEIL